MSGKPWIKWYPADWRAEATLRLVSRAARSLWIDLLGMIHEAGDGRLHIDGHQPTEKELSMILGDNPRTLRKLLSELENAGVFSRDQDGFIVSRRIIRDLQKHEQDVSNGRKGGSPLLKSMPYEGEGVNPTDKAQKPEARSQKEKEKSEKEKFAEMIDEKFETFWQAYPDRKGDPKKPARQKFETKVRNGTDPETIIDAARRYAKTRQGQDQQFTKQAKAWLNQECWDVREVSGQANGQAPPLKIGGTRIQEWQPIDA